MPCEGTRLVLYTKDHARSKMRPLYVKIMVYRPFSLAVGCLRKKKKLHHKKVFLPQGYITLRNMHIHFTHAQDRAPPIYMHVRSPNVPRPSHAPARKRVWNLSQDFLALLNQHDDVYYVIQNDCHVHWEYGLIPMRAYTLGNWNWNRAVLLVRIEVT